MEKASVCLFSQVSQTKLTNQIVFPNFTGLMVVQAIEELLNPQKEINNRNFDIFDSGCNRNEEKYQV